jgi:hypothetical protein
MALCKKPASERYAFARRKQAHLQISSGPGSLRVRFGPKPVVRGHSHMQRLCALGGDVAVAMLAPVSSFSYARGLAVRSCDAREFERHRAKRLKSANHSPVLMAPHEGIDVVECSLFDQVKVRLGAGVPDETLLHGQDASVR